ncbi:TlpA family protein disulfide reductase [Streptomyces sp. NPDC057654]|uniref:TlpA family protein disulfide reductase n=1 Tax=Streptomyces sp. NPDC057654 TaxID=3346196 RepID=UPI0036CE8DC3
MAYLIAAVVLVGALCLLDLLLTVGLIRRLRAQQPARTPSYAGGIAGKGTDQVTDQWTGGGTDAAMDEGMLPPGAIVGTFETRTVDDRTLRNRDLGVGVKAGAGAVVVFLSPGCPPCHAQLPRVAAALGGASVNGAVAVVAGGSDGDSETEQMVQELGALTTVVRESIAGPVTEAFGVRAFPSMCRVRAVGDELVVEAVGEHVLPAPAAVIR